MNKRLVFLFWGVMDLLTLSSFVVTAFRSNRIPFHDDFQDFMRLSSDHGWYAGFVFGMSVALYFSLLLSLFLFFKRSRLAKPVAYVQIPFRLLLAVPSVTVFSWLVGVFGSASGIVIILLKLLSELIKFLTLRFGCKPDAPLYS